MSGRLAMAGLTLVFTAGLARGQKPADGIDLHGALGAAASGGRDTRDNGGMFAKLGMGFVLPSKWRLNADGEIFARTASSGCVTPSAECMNAFPSTVAMFLLGGARSFANDAPTGPAVHLAAGVGPAAIASTPTSPSVTAFTADVGVDFDLIRRGRAALTAGIHGVIASNVRAGNLWLVPVTIGARF